MHGCFRLVGLAFSIPSLPYRALKRRFFRADNVVRAGLTPKLRDVPTLVSMLTYTSLPADAQLMDPSAFRGLSHTTLYDPPIDEFSVLLTRLESGQAEVHPAIDGPSIVLVTEGKGRLTSGEIDGEIGEGSVWFVAAGQEVKLAAEGQLEVYRAFVEAP